MGTLAALARPSNVRARAGGQNTVNCRPGGSPTSLGQPAPAVLPDVASAVEWERAFLEWLAMPFEAQRADVRAYVSSAGKAGIEARLTLEHYRDFSPHPDDDPETRLFRCGLIVHLAVVRAEREMARGRPTRAVRAAFGLMRKAEAEHGSLTVSLKTKAALVQLSPNRFGQAFSRFTGLDFRKFMRKLRVLWCVCLAHVATMSADDIAFQLGYCSPSNLRRDLRKEIGAGFQMLELMPADHVQDSAIPDSPCWRS